MNLYIVRHAVAHKRDIAFAPCFASRGLALIANRQ